MSVALQEPEVEPAIAPTSPGYVMTDLITGLAMRHSISPAVSDFATCTANSVPPADTLSILNAWQAQGILFNKIANDNVAVDGVPNRFQMNHNGTLVARSLITPATQSSISPTSGQAGTTFTLSVVGTGFDSKSFISIQGASVGPTTFVSATQLTASVTLRASNLPGFVASLPVAVCNHKWGTTTTIQNLTVTLGPAPSISGLSPSTAVHGGVAFTLTVNGSNFVSGCTVQFAGVAKATTFVNAGQVTASILAADIASAGTKPVTVQNPDGGISPASNFTVT